MIDTFGVQRIFWGTDISHLVCAYEEAKAFFFELPFLSGAALEAVMGGALRDWLGWKRC